LGAAQKHHIIAIASVENTTKPIGDQQIIACAAVKTIGTLATIQCIVSPIANEHIGASITHEAVGTLPASGAFNADQHILAVFKARGRTRQKIKKDGFVC
jgi:hypothetical protein